MKRLVNYLIALSGGGLSVYLFLRFLTLQSGAEASKGICKAVFGYSCDPVLVGSGAVVFGLPWAAWGIIYFGMLFVLMALSDFLPDSFSKSGKSATLIVLLGGNLISLFLIGMMVSGLAPICLLCLIIHLLDLLLFWIYFRYSHTTLRELFKQFFAGMRFLITGQGANPEQGKWHLAVFLIPLLFGLTIYQRLAFPISHVVPGGVLEPTFDLLAEYQHTPIADLTISDRDAKLGPDTALFKMVVFSDFECPYCASFAQKAKAWVAKYPNRFQLIFKHFPLSSTCNPVMEDDMHPNACEAARVSQAALRQNRFWEMHDLLFENEVSEELYLKWASDLGMNPEQFQADVSGQDGLDKILDDVAMGNVFGVEGTPSVFLNGRKLSEIQPQNIEVLLDNLMRMTQE